MYYTNFQSYLNIMKHIQNYFYVSFLVSYKQCSKRNRCTFTNQLYCNTIIKNSLLNYLTFSTSVQEIPPPIFFKQLEKPDIFGKLGSLKYEQIMLDEEELKEEKKQKYLHAEVPRKYKPSLGEYVKMIKNYSMKGDIVAAQKVMEYCVANKDKPTAYMYSLLIYQFAIQGDLINCYKYFSEMKTRHYKIKSNIYTSLFNACANYHDKDRALKYLEKIREFMKRQKVPLHYTHYNVLMKAYGRHGDFKRSEKLAEYMINCKLKIGITTVNSLLYAANSDTKSGLKHIFNIWQFMRQQKIPPNIFTYNLLLRGIQNTEFGNFTVNDLLDANHTGFLIGKPDLLSCPPAIDSLPFPNIYKKSSRDNKLIDPPVLEQLLIAKSNELNNSLNKEVISTEILDMNLDIILKHNKLILFGGFTGVLEKMDKDKVIPDIKTLTYLLELLPNSVSAEESLIKYAYSRGIKPDLNFYNCLIKKRCIRGDKKQAKQVINDIHKADLKPNVMTYGVLAFSCECSNELYQILETMESTGIVINKYIAHSLLIFATNKLNFPFILLLMKILKRERVHIDEEIFLLLDTFQKKCTNIVKTKHKFSTLQKFKTGFSKFNMRYKSWQEEMGRKILCEVK